MCRVSELSVQIIVHTCKDRDVTSEQEYIETVNRDVGASTREHIHANRQVKTQRFGAFRVHLMLDLLTQESDKNPGLFFLHNLKRKKKKVINRKRSSPLTTLAHFVDVYRFSFCKPLPDLVLARWYLCIYRRQTPTQSLGVNMEQEGVKG